MAAIEENQTSSQAERLSALIDGELGASDFDPVCAQWRKDADLRESWHAYQLIGDVLRSDDLASAPGHDLEFMVALRKRMAQEPVVVAPAQVAQAASVRDPQALPASSSWATVSRPRALAAGLFLALTGAWAAYQWYPSGPLQVEVLAQSYMKLDPPSGSAAVPVDAVEATDAFTGQALPVADEESALLLDGQLVRDARLEEYFAAHKKFGGSSAPGNPSGFLRHAHSQDH